MYYAITKDNNRIHARNAKRQAEYRCPVCNDVLILRNGVIKTAHFAHRKNSQCTDNWTYDVSDFRCNWQNMFEDASRELVISNGHEIKHIADVVDDDFVLEFQHSKIKMTEFRERNKFFMECGYHVVWLIDLTDAFEEQEIVLDETKGVGVWKNPAPMMKALKRNADLGGKKLVIFAQLGESYANHKVEPVIIKLQDIRFADKEMQFSFGRKLNANEFLNIYKLSEKIEVSLAQEIETEKDESAPKEEKQYSILYLWKMNYRVAIFYNKKHDTYAKIFDDQAEIALKSKERKWMGYIRSGKFKSFSKKQMEVYGADNPEWVVKWFVTHQDAVY